MTQLIYRKLEQHEAELLGAIDRTEHIDAIYRTVDGTLQLEPARQTVASWEDHELSAYVSRLHGTLASGGYVHGAWHEHQLVGIASLDVAAVGGDRTCMKLDLLYVSSPYRRMGIARTLVAWVVARARSLGARRLYISATPTRATVDAYLRIGAHVLAVPDAEMLAREPDDIHLGLNIPTR